MKSERPRAKRNDDKRNDSKGRAGRGAEPSRGDTKRGDTQRSDTKRGDTKRSDTKRDETKRGDTKRSEERWAEKPRADAKRGAGQRANKPRHDDRRDQTQQSDKSRGERKRNDAPRSERPRSGQRRGDARHASNPRDEAFRSEGKRQGPARGKRPQQAGGAARSFGTRSLATAEARTSNRRAERAAFADRRKKGAPPAREFHADDAFGSANEWDAPKPAGAARNERSKPISGELDKARLERVPYPKIPAARSQLKGEPHPGQWLLTTREGSEQDLVDELLLSNVIDPGPCVFAPGLVLAPKVPKRDKRAIDLTFARQGFEILTSVRAQDLDELTHRVERSLRNKLAHASTYALHVWVPDTTLTNPLSSLAEELETRLADRLATNLPKGKRVDDSSLRRLGSMPLAQVCLLDTERAVAGVMHSNATPSLARGGRTRVRVSGDAPSRAARKLEEALAWLGVEPGPGEVCVDLGAAPGGWTYVLAERRARVIAVDPAKLRPDILAKKGVRHLQESAFTYTPDEPIDWLFCDMAWRPLEAAALLAKWGRKRWARMIVANIKLPMTKKAEILARIRAILETEGEWNGLRFKQLYHDRDEITLTAHRA